MWHAYFKVQCFTYWTGEFCLVMELHWERYAIRGVTPSSFCSLLYIWNCALVQIDQTVWVLNIGILKYYVRRPPINNNDNNKFNSSPLNYAISEIQSSQLKVSFPLMTIYAVTCRT